MEFLEEAERLMAETRPESRAAAYQLMKRHLDAHRLDPNFMWRMAKTTHMYVEALLRSALHNHCKQLQLEAKEYALTALELDSESADVHQWCAQTIGGWTRFVGARDKIRIGFLYKMHIDKAIQLRPTDSRLRHLRGRFCFEIASLSWLERKLAKFFYEEPPDATYQEALEEFFQAEKLEPGGSVDNLLQIARTYLAIGDSYEAKKFLGAAEKTKAKSPEDATAADEAKKLIAQLK